jgi:hypothetical protein
MLGTVNNYAVKFILQTMEVRLSIVKQAKLHKIFNLGLFPQVLIHMIKRILRLIITMATVDLTQRSLNKSLMVFQ